MDDKERLVKLAEVVGSNHPTLSAFSIVPLRYILRLILTIVGQIQQQYENVHYTDSFIPMKQ
jgi:hypothetical protein